MNVQCHACIGGTSIGEDIRKVDYGQYVVSGTPGPVVDMIGGCHLCTRNIEILLDEADDMYRYLPPATQVGGALYAPLPYFRMMCWILIKRDELTVEGIKRFFVLTPEFSRHGEMARKEHDAIMAEFRGGSSRVLIATEVSARGIEVEQLSLPRTFSYRHPISNWVVTIEDVRILRDIGMFYSAQIVCFPNTVHIIQKKR
ncbi:hypothetical protein BS47DRAFT_1376737 [Hydnum rufescens UP504]|uniref:Helicase C-terminal domain-containing protein n=1 Tax=Hydnum rufescens UP504 TaxID=1448309 RepID=A0A9P6AWT4_9AGAM|nr:hypothetical protein BS47DRAFT_1376737 [Hydnum rufescens UP504]